MAEIHFTNGNVLRTFDRGCVISTPYHAGPPTWMVDVALGSFDFGAFDTHWWDDHTHRVRFRRPSRSARIHARRVKAARRRG